MSPALRLTTWMPSTSRVERSKTILKMPCSEFVKYARVTDETGWTTVSTSCPASRASASVRPRPASSGSVKIAVGSSE